MNETKEQVIPIWPDFAYSSVRTTDYINYYFDTMVRAQVGATIVHRRAHFGISSYVYDSQEAAMLNAMKRFAMEVYRAQTGKD